MAVTGLDPELERAMWAGDMERLWELAPCRCCCDEHTFGRGCPAYQWGGCRGQGSDDTGELESWVRHYQTQHGMTEAEFYGVGDPPIGQEG